MNEIDFKIPTQSPSMMMDMKNGQGTSSKYYYTTTSPNGKYEKNHKLFGHKFGALLVLIAFSIVFGKLFVQLSMYILIINIPS